MGLPLTILLSTSFLLASCTGDGCGDSYRWALDRSADLHRCAEKGHVRAQMRYGMLLAVSGRDAEGETWLRRVSEPDGRVRAMEIARALDRLGGNRTAAERWYRRAHDHGGWEPALELGLNRHANGDRAAAERWFERAVERGGGWAAGTIALRLTHSKDHAAGTAWYRRAASMGERSAMTAYAHALSAGKGIAKDEEEAFRWYRRAAMHPQADGYDLLKLATLHDEGVGTPRDPGAALAAVRLARHKRIDDSDTINPGRMAEMEARLSAAS